MQTAARPPAFRHSLRCLIFAVGAATLSALVPVRAQSAAALATALPIADAHFHFMAFMTVDELVAHMKKNKVQWIVSAAAVGSSAVGPGWPRDLAVKERLGPRYLAGVGGMEFFKGEQDYGTAFFTQADSAPRKEVLGKVDELLKVGGRSLAETLPNAESSSPFPLWRRRLPTDAPFFDEVLDIATRHKLPLPMHMEWHPDSVAQLGALLERHPQGVVILSHCGKTSTAAGVRPMLEKYPNLYCDLSYRSPPQEKSNQDSNRTIFWPEALFSKAGIKKDWLQLIEDFPERFMVGVDDVHSWNDYDGVVTSIRQGLLAQLTPATAEKVAWRNTVRLFRLPEAE